MTMNDRQTRALADGERPLVRHAERYRLSAGAQSIEGAGEILRVGSKEGNSLRLQNETVSRYHFEIESTPNGFLGGTLFLDEIGELPLDLQPKLLRALERREIRRVGGSQVIPADVRVLAATNRDLLREINRGAFREDLYYRLAVVRVRVPPLRERREDIPLLVEHFVREALDGDEAEARRVTAGISEANWQGLLAHPWPGNVRELRNFIERTLAVSGGVEAEKAPPAPLRLPSTAPGTAAPDAAPGAPEAAIDLSRPFIEAREELLGRFEKAYLEAMLARHGGNISRAARAAGLDRMHFKRLLAKHQGD